MNFLAEEVAIGLWAFAAAGYWYVEHPLKHTAPSANATFIREETGWWDEASENDMHRKRAKQSARWRDADNFRVRIRRLLDQLGTLCQLRFSSTGEKYADRNSRCFRERQDFSSISVFLQPSHCPPR